MKEKLNAIKVRLNPSGFTFLRYINTHFEYYASLSKIDEPLFVPLAFGKNDTYNFEYKMRKVLELVKKHITLMRNFYSNKFEEERGFTVTEFKHSIFSFKYFGQETLPRDKGYFQSVRILNSHIDYISVFRIYILNVDTSISDSEIVRINKKILSILEEYTLLLSNDVDFAGKGFSKKFREKITLIKNSNYLNKDIRVHIN